MHDLAVCHEMIARGPEIRQQLGVGPGHVACPLYRKCDPKRHHEDDSDDDEMDGDEEGDNEEMDRDTEDDDDEMDRDEEDDDGMNNATGSVAEDVDE